MTATAATIEALPRLGLPELESNQAAKARPAGETEQNAADRTHIGVPDRLARDRIHHATILSIIAGVQLAWIAVLIYGLFLYA